MKYLLLLLPLIVLAQTPSAPTNLRVTAATTAVDLPVGSIIPLTVTVGSDNPLAYPINGIAAWWTAPDTNVWEAQWTTNGSQWTRAGCEWAQIPDRATRLARTPYAGWHYTEATTNALVNPANWRVRLVRIH